MKREELSEAGEELMRDLSAFRRLAGQLQRQAQTADNHLLRAILGKREALLDSIRRKLDVAQAQSADEAPAPAGLPAEMSAEEKTWIGRTVAEIASLDGQTERILEQRAGAVTDEIQKLRAGKQWRENAQRWK